MKRLAFVAMILVLCAAALRAADPAQSAGAEKAAEASAQSWLALVDAGKYGDSWDAAAAVFRSALSREQWIQALDKVRRPLGKVVSRKLRGAQYATELPNAPKGEYVVIQFDAAFENKSGAVETITPAKDKDGTWRVSGYFIR
jgi:opacity protein-like surface antigen